MFAKRPLSREVREMIAVVVSKANKCAYCVIHHSEALNFYWKDRVKMSSFIENYRREYSPDNLVKSQEYRESLTLNFS